MGYINENLGLNNRVAISFVVSAFFWTCVILYIAVSSISHNPIQLPYSKKLNVDRLIPQGWAFFTRDPREPIIKYYELRNDEWTSTMLGPNARASHFFGARRIARAQNTEAALLQNDIHDSLWTHCTKNIRACLDETGISDTVQNNSPVKTLCGTIGFAQQKRLPWAWNNSRDDLKMPSYVLIIEAKCHDE